MTYAEQRNGYGDRKIETLRKTAQRNEKTSVGKPRRGFREPDLFVTEDEGQRRPGKTLGELMRVDDRLGGKARREDRIAGFSQMTVRRLYALVPAYVGVQMRALADLPVDSEAVSGGDDMNAVDAEGFAAADDRGCVVGIVAFVEDDGEGDGASGEHLTKPRRPSRGDEAIQRVRSHRRRQHPLKLVRRVVFQPCLRGACRAKGEAPVRTQNR